MNENGNNNPMSMEMIINIHSSIARMEAKIDAIGDVSNVANNAMSSAKSAHHRLDKMDKIIFWTATTIIGGLVLGALGILFNSVK